MQSQDQSHSIFSPQSFVIEPESTIIPYKKTMRLIDHSVAYAKSGRCLLIVGSLRWVYETINSLGDSPDVMIGDKQNVAWLLALRRVGSAAEEMYSIPLFTDTTTYFCTDVCIRR